MKPRSLANRRKAGEGAATPYGGKGNGAALNSQLNRYEKIFKHEL